MEQLTVEQWRERILAGWEKWGTGKPLDPRTVEHLAQEFAKPLEPLEFSIRPFDWDKLNSRTPHAYIPWSYYALPI